jgi:hypothetical protein
MLLGQTIAEKEAWRIADKEGLKLVTICPNFVLGPVISDRSTGTSLGYMKVERFPAENLLLLFCSFWSQTCFGVPPLRRCVDSRRQALAPPKDETLCPSPDAIPSFRPSAITVVEQ